MTSKALATVPSRVLFVGPAVPAPIVKHPSSIAIVKRSSTVLARPRPAGTIKSTREGKLTAHEVRVLYRTYLSESFGRRDLTWEELDEYTNGRNTDIRTWDRLIALGYIKETRSDCKTTRKGLVKLRELGKIR